MKKLTKIIAAATLSFTVLGAAHASPEFVPTDDQAGTKLCVTATTGNIFKMHKAMKANKLTKRYVTEKMTCNGQNIVAFIEQYGDKSTKMNNYLTNGKYSEMPSVIASVNTHK
tara:strand:+ start:294 stop:632 length:339 start_codon:yes stop_codon:yes gene_type:complete